MKQMQSLKFWILVPFAIGLMTVMQLFSYTVRRDSLVRRHKENECIRDIVESMSPYSPRNQGKCNKLDSMLDSCLLRNVETKNLTLCPEASPYIKGPVEIHIDKELSHLAENANHSMPALPNWPPTMEELAVQHSYLTVGGTYTGPEDCLCRATVAVVVPFRDRELHLRYFLYYVHRIMQRQQLCYTVIVVEQDDDEIFNRGQMVNTGFKYANQLRKFDCFVLHDVDLIAEDDRVPYTCRKEVIHLGAYLDKNKYKIFPGLTVGAALSFTSEQYQTVNGFSNEFVGWGGDDDDMQKRIYSANLKIWRGNQTYVRFRMLKHKRDEGNPVNPLRFQRITRARMRMQQDGLNSLKTTLVDVTKHITHTRLKVKSFKTPFIEEAEKSLRQKNQGRI